MDGSKENEHGPGKGDEHLKAKTNVRVIFIVEIKDVAYRGQSNFVGPLKGSLMFKVLSGVKLFADSNSGGETDNSDETQ